MLDIDALDPETPASEIPDLNDPTRRLRKRRSAF
jgi:hypothetical protein